MNMITQINKPLITGPFKKMARAISLFALTLAALGYAAAPALAQEKTLTLDEAVKLGIQNSKVLKLSQSKIDQAVSKYNQAKDQALPTGSASFIYYGSKILVI